MTAAIRLRYLALLMLVISVGLCSLYWWRLTESHRQTLADVTGQTERYATQVADAVAQQISTLVRGVDFALHEMRDSYARGEDRKRHV